VGAFKMIVYPFGFAIGAMFLVSLLSMGLFGVHSADWADWQNEFVISVGTVAGLAGAVIGLWLAIQTERHTTH